MLHVQAPSRGKLHGAAYSAGPSLAPRSERAVLDHSRRPSCNHRRDAYRMVVLLATSAVPRPVQPASFGKVVPSPLPLIGRCHTVEPTCPVLRGRSCLNPRKTGCSLNGSERHRHAVTPRPSAAVRKTGESKLRRRTAFRRPPISRRATQPVATLGCNASDISLPCSSFASQLALACSRCTRTV